MVFLWFSRGFYGFRGSSRVSMVFEGFLGFPHFSNFLTNFPFFLAGLSVFFLVYLLF